MVHFGRKMVCDAVHNASLNTVTMGTAFPVETTPVQSALQERVEQGGAQGPLSIWHF